MMDTDDLVPELRDVAINCRASTAVGEGTIVLFFVLFASEVVLKLCFTAASISYAGIPLQERSHASDGLRREMSRHHPRRERYHGFAPASTAIINRRRVLVLVLPDLSHPPRLRSRVPPQMPVCVEASED